MLWQIILNQVVNHMIKSLYKKMNVATFALGSRPRQWFAKVRAKSEA